MIWGVAGGLAEHVGFNPTLVRVFFVVTLFFGGAGLLAYLVLAVALPEDDEPAIPCPRASGRGSARWCSSASWSPWGCSSQPGSR